ncbi:hypothetical protein QR680_009011 [Steinernema hermaphroditum]|uniref:Uncharacterized protein n=1 Tax=Steinernema hermaphroditum TaxID=289476 RepID=A0AA39IL50_9BILA|nr:hypothetical protein QR680_009011 [Steinernema hermaphroditum]
MGLCVTRDKDAGWKKNKNKKTPITKQRDAAKEKKSTTIKTTNANLDKPSNEELQRKQNGPNSFEDSAPLDTKVKEKTANRVKQEKSQDANTPVCTDGTIPISGVKSNVSTPFEDNAFLETKDKEKTAHQTKEEKPKNIKIKNEEKKRSGDARKKMMKKDEDLYPKVREPTGSERKRKKAALEASRKKKIADGFYQSSSDVDDTLEAIGSLKPEESDVNKTSQSEKPW